MDNPQPVLEINPDLEQSNSRNPAGPFLWKKNQTSQRLDTHTLQLSGVLVRGY